MKALLVLLSLFPISALAYDIPDLGPGLGVSVTNTEKGNYYSLLLEDVHHFNQLNNTLYHVVEYGYGHAEFEFGNGFGVNLTANSGMAWVHMRPDQEGVHLFFGTDIGGRLILNTDGDVHSYYEWLPALAPGLQFGLGQSRLVIAGKLGVAVGDYDRPNWWPDANASYGLGIDLATQHFFFGADMLYFGSNQMYTADALVKLNDYWFGVRGEDIFNNSLGIQEERISVMFKARWLP